MKKRALEIRTIEPTLEEKREMLVQDMDNLVNKAELETRSLNDDEITKFDEIKAAIEKIDKTLETREVARVYIDGKKLGSVTGVEVKEETRENKEEIRAIFEQREAMNTTVNAEGGFVVSEFLTKEIIKALKERSEVYSFFNGTTLPGSVKIPKKTKEGKAEWVDENPSGTPDPTIPKLELLELGQNRLYRESAITQQMINTQELDLEAFIKDDVVESMTDAIEDSIFNGTGTKQPKGLIGDIKKKISLDTRGQISLDHFKKAKAKIKKAAWGSCKWFMHSDTFLEVDLLKDGMGRPLLQPDVTSATGYSILGIPVELTDSMPTLQETGAKCAVVLATPNAYHTNTQKSMALYTYDDSAFKRKGLVGYGADLYMDGKVKNDDQLVGIFNKAA